MAQGLKAELLNEKLAEIARLKAEVAQLRGTSHGGKQVALKVKVVEVSLKDLKALGIGLPGTCDAECGENDCTGGACEKTAGATCGVKPVTLAVANRQSIEGFVDALVEQNLAKVLDAPTIVLASGRRAKYVNGGEFAVPTLMPDKTVHVEHKPFGTELEAMATVLDDNHVRLELHPRITEVCPYFGLQAAGMPVPGVRVHEFASTLDMTLGQTAILGGRVQPRIEMVMKTSGLHENPAYRFYIAASAVAGGPEVARAQFVAPKRECHTNHVQTLFLVTPELVDESYEHHVPATAKVPSIGRAK
jgi:pilus assembly protein CpaC